MDHIPSHERMKLRRRLRSPEAYERLREKVKGPEDMEREMKKNEALAELHFAMESEPTIHDALQKQVEKDIREKGIEQVIDAPNMSPEIQKNLEQGKFILTVSAHPKTHQDALVVIPEGHVQEKLPLRVSFSDQYVGQFQSSGNGSGRGDR